MFIYFLKKKTAILICSVTVLLLILCISSPAVFVNNTNDESDSSEAQKNEYIKWVDFNVPLKALEETLKADTESYGKDLHFDWIELLAYLATKYGGNWKQYKTTDLKNLTESLSTGKTMEELTEKMKNYDYFLEAYTAVLDGFVGEYEIEVSDKNNSEKTVMTKKYGLKAFSPIARGYSFSHYDDFGNSRSYGYKRKHLGHDLMGSVGTPIIAIESGIVECAGWNQYGGWRIGIRSFDSKRYYYYAHLRKNHPYNDIYEGKVVSAGDVIGYLGMTGYSTKENVNNINTPHLHFGVQLIFDERQKEGANEIWIDLYAITELLQKNKSAVVKDAENKEYYRKYKFDEPILHDFKKQGQ